MMADETLIDREIEDLGERLLEPFDPSRVKGASYDIRVGKRIRLVLPKPDGTAQFQWVALDMPGAPSSIPISPGSTCIVESREKVHMPNDMKARLALRAFHARRLIFFPGGVIDPGYDDFLHLPMANMGDVPVELKYEEPLVSVEFVRLDKEAKPYQPTRPPEEEQPTVFDRERLSREVQQQGKSIQEMLKRLERNETIANASQRILDMVVLAAVAAGAIAAVIYFFPSLSFPWNAVVAVGLGITLGTIAIATLIRAVFRSRQK